ncbi:MAG: helix-turn-helix transcriptional regulator [Clostridia bacterium]|nr:helix-turn-helix transcriptional regulator [Clostridia bacterium]
MHYEGELKFLCDTLNKNHINTHFVSPETTVGSVADPAISSILNQKTADLTLGELFGEISLRTLHRHTDPFGLCYSYLVLDVIEKKKKILLIGPYILAGRSPSQSTDFCKRLDLPQKYRKHLENYYFSIPVLQDNNPLFIMLDTFCEIIWQTSNYSVSDVISDALVPASPINNADQHDIMMSMRNMERRYAVENELMEAVTYGKLHRLKAILAQFPEEAFEKRHADPLRNMKNYGVIVNTLLRKAAEQGGVHPMYLDKVSSSFAIKIEQLTTPTSIKELIGEMFTSYCRLVKKHSIKQYSPIVQKVIITIDADLSADLSLSSLAESQNVSAGYLCTLFRKETGKTLIEYIREKRIQHARHLLATTHLQIQTVALNCGIVDVQYFSKTFKKLVGKTPKEFREDAKNNAF